MSKNLIVEKITGSRLHLYVIDEIALSYSIVVSVVAYSYRLAGYLNSEIPKYKMLSDFRINAGAAFGAFFEFEFTSKKGFSEMTTIGYAANYAAKLQALSGIGKFSVSKKIFDSIAEDEKKHYKKIEEEKIQKYGQKEYYTVCITKVGLSAKITESDMETVKEYANRVNLKDIEFSMVRKQLNFKDLSKTQCKKLRGIPVFSDVRGFTTQFDKDGENLDEMAKKTQNILEAMYDVSICNGGVHVQFQGDRELSLYHNIPEQKVNGVNQPEKGCFKSAVLASMRMIDAVKPYAVHIGVGEDFGELFATKIGARGEKDNILLGKTVVFADNMEDRNASADQVAITSNVYNGLRSEDEYLAKQFKKKDDFYVATIGYKKYMSNLSYRQQSDNSKEKKYNPAWGETL